MPSNLQNESDNLTSILPRKPLFSLDEMYPISCEKGCAISEELFFSPGPLETSQLRLQNPATFPYMNANGEWTTRGKKPFENLCKKVSLLETYPG